MKWLKTPLKKVIKKQTLFYEQTFLRDHIDVNPSKKPRLTHDLSSNMVLELYVGDSSDGRDDYATAVIAVTLDGRVHRQKYDSGRVFKDLDGMLSDCIHGIASGWTLSHFRKVAKDDINRQLDWKDKLVHGGV